MDGVFALQRRECLEVLGSHTLTGALHEGGIHERHTAALEAGPGETSPVDAVSLRHDVVEFFEFRRSGLPVLNGRESTGEGNSPELLYVALSPGLGTLLYPLKFGEVVSRTTEPRLRQPLTVAIEDLAGNLSHRGLCYFPIVQPRVGQQCVCGRTAFIHSHIEFRRGQRTFKPGEEDDDAVGLHRWGLRDEFVGAVLGIQVEKLVLATIDLAALVEGAAGDTNVFILGSFGKLDNLRFGEPDVIDLGKCHQESDGHCRRGGEPPNRQAPLDDTSQPDAEFILHAQLDGHAAQVVRPVALFGLRSGGDVELCAFAELKARQLHDTILLGVIRNANATVQRQARDLAQLMVHMSTHRTDAVGTEGHVGRLAVVDFLEAFDAIHNNLSGSARAEFGLGLEQFVEVCNGLYQSLA